ncbi:MAG TPA: hypothetical protein PKY30_10760 [Myxococcota bacterium]|nr:hypothetical protein [Myxococcota bacterium]HND33093.1 hypothetical protein [Myxococcota bacterium]HNH47511.1 hypothetical protein [Myxococcota bacterium]
MSCSIPGCQQPVAVSTLCALHDGMFAMPTGNGWRPKRDQPIVSARGMRVVKKHEVKPGNCTKCKGRLAGYCCDAPGCAAALCGRCVREVAGSEYCPAHDPSGVPQKRRKNRNHVEEEE